MLVPGGSLAGRPACLVRVSGWHRPREPAVLIVDLDVVRDAVHAE
jgi:hypothetical protein